MMAVTVAVAIEQEAVPVSRELVAKQELHFVHSLD
jgi:hypothetical protein